MSCSLNKDVWRPAPSHSVIASHRRVRVSLLDDQSRGLRVHARKNSRLGCVCVLYFVPGKDWNFLLSFYTQNLLGFDSYLEIE